MRQYGRHPPAPRRHAEPIVAPMVAHGPAELTVERDFDHILISKRWQDASGYSCRDSSFVLPIDQARRLTEQITALLHDGEIASE